MARICALLFTFIIFLNSVQSSNQPTRPNEQHPIPATAPRQYNDNEIVYEGGRPCGIRVGQKVYRSGPVVLQGESIKPPRHNQQPPGPIFLQDGDIIKRNQKHVARVQGHMIYEIHPVVENESISQQQHQKECPLEEGDLIIRKGRAIGRVKDRQIQRVFPVVQPESSNQLTCPNELHPISATVPCQNNDNEIVYEGGRPCGIRDGQKRQKVDRSGTVLLRGGSSKQQKERNSTK